MKWRSRYSPQRVLFLLHRTILDIFTNLGMTQCVARDRIKKMAVTLLSYTRKKTLRCIWYQTQNNVRVNHVHQVRQERDCVDQRSRQSSWRPSRGSRFRAVIYGGINKVGVPAAEPHIAPETRGKLDGGYEREIAWGRTDTAGPVLIKWLSAEGPELNISPSKKKCIILKVTACITLLSSTAESDKQRVSGTPPTTACPPPSPSASPCPCILIYSLLSRDDVLKGRQLKWTSRAVYTRFSLIYTASRRTLIIHSPVSRDKPS